jgi:hypothetical protein
MKPFLSREDFFKRAMQAIARMQQLRREHNWDDDDVNLFYSLAGEETPLPLQIHVFIPCMKALASEEQLAKWLPKARSYEMIGCYAQTELAHGSNVAGTHFRPYGIFRPPEQLMMDLKLFESQELKLLRLTCLKAISSRSIHLMRMPPSGGLVRWASLPRTASFSLN